MTITPIYPRKLQENIIPSQARDLLEIIKRGLESGRFKVINGTIVLAEQEEDHERRTGRI
jgi:hypothetical protein